MKAPEEHRLSSPLGLVQEHSLTSALKWELERLILEGEIKGGERLNETTLATRFRTSRGPLREALQALGEQGIVSFTRNRGAFVRQVSAEDALELYSIRAALEDEVGRQLAGRLDADQSATLEALVTEMDRLIKGRRVGEYYDLNLRFHDLLVEYSGNTRLAAVYRRVIKELHLFRLYGLAQGAALGKSNTEHRAILEALRRRTPAKAARAMRGHVEAALRRVRTTVVEGRG